MLQPEEEKLLNEIRERKTTLNQNQPIVEEPVKKVDPKKNTKPDPKKKDRATNPANYFTRYEQAMS